MATAPRATASSARVSADKVGMAAEEVVDTVAVLLALFGSGVAEETETVLVTVVPAARFVERCSTMLNVATLPAAREDAVQATVPLVPAAGVVQVNAGPLVCVAETNPAFAGVMSVSVTVVASDGPRFVSVTVYTMSLPAPALAGPVLATARSAEDEIVVVADDELLAGTGSVLAAVTVAVLVSAAEDEGDGLTTSENVALAPGTRVAAVHATVPVAPAAGVVQMNAGPLVCVAETNVAVAGSTSETETLAASEGPPLVTVTV